MLAAQSSIMKWTTDSQSVDFRMNERQCSQTMAVPAGQLATQPLIHADPRRLSEPATEHNSLLLESCSCLLRNTSNSERAAGNTQELKTWRGAGLNLTWILGTQSQKGMLGYSDFTLKLSQFSLIKLGGLFFIVSCYILSWLLHLRSWYMLKKKFKFTQLKKIAIRLS